MNKKKIVLLISIFWLIIIVGFIVIKEFTLRTGDGILLKTQPIDPRDLFRGDYVILNYEISTLDLRLLDIDPTEFNINQRVFIKLDDQDGYGNPIGIYEKTPSDGLFMKGTIRNIQDSVITIEYGIESYFVPEGMGMTIESQSGRNLDVMVKIDKFGNSIINSLLIDGKEINLD
ncbi:MAG: GDYXXLXY domain-containing protein [Nanoarchaeota archaeon]